VLVDTTPCRRMILYIVLDSFGHVSECEIGDNSTVCMYGLQGYSVKFSPFEQGKVAVATAQNFGIIGNGKQYVLQVSGAEKCVCRGCRMTGRMHERLAVQTINHFICDLQMTEQGLVEIRSFDTADGLYDCAWSEENENILISASGDGSIKAWDVNAPPQANPLRSLEEHTHEVYSLHWNLVRRDCFLSASWDDTVKLWNMASPNSLRTFTGHTYCVYAAQWCVWSRSLE